MSDTQLQVNQLLQVGLLNLHHQVAITQDEVNSLGIQLKGPSTPNILVFASPNTKRILTTPQPLSSKDSTLLGHRVIITHSFPTITSRNHPN